MLVYGIYIYIYTCSSIYHLLEPKHQRSKEMIYKLNVLLLTHAAMRALLLLLPTYLKVWDHTHQ